MRCTHVAQISPWPAPVAGTGPRSSEPCRDFASSQAAPTAIIARLRSWAWVSPRRTSSLRRMNSTSKRSRPGQDEVDGEQDPGLEAVAKPPQQVGDQAHGEGLVDRRRVDRLVDRLGAVRVGHRPGAVPGLAVVAVAGQLAADPPDRVAERQRRRAEVEQGGVEHAAPPRPQPDADRAPDRAAVPDQARAGEDVAEQVVLDRVVVLDDEVEPRADDAADQARRGSPRRPSPGACPTPGGAGRAARRPR